MVDRGLVEHIKKELGLGRDIKVIRDRLLKTGFPYLDVHEAIDLSFRELSAETKDIQRKVEKEKNLAWNLLKPKKRKLIIPFIVLLTLLLHFFGNVSYLPDIGKRLCASSELALSLEKAINQNSSSVNELQKKVLDQQVVMIDEFRNLLFFNFPFMGSRAYRFNPFFPAPCELTEFAYTPYCVYYISNQDYRCILQNEEKSEKKYIPTLFGGNIPEYRKVSGPILIINTLLLLLEYYIINCFIIYFYEKAKNKMTEKKKETLQLTIIISIILLLILAVLSYLYLLNLIGLKFG